VLTIGGKGSFVPDVLLKSEGEAVGLLKTAGFTPQVSYYAETSGGMVGRVKTTEPLPYRALPPGGAVKLLVGRASFDMPNLAGMLRPQASQVLEQISAVKGLGLKPTVVTRETGAIAEDGKVFDQTPKAGAPLAPGTPVTLHVWRWVYTMPNFIGMTDREAFAILNQINAQRPGFIKLSATQTRDAAREADNNRIHDQSPKAGTIVPPGATAFFQTYRYKPVPIPNRPNVTPGRR
jgi:beta-lactam-binding protein with PASTA domain